ncbi:alanyl-tRNA synthetase [Alkaliphilus peptidifermentans DSM 18978]|uniref:Alanine--tRNA ligase n=1 Tax=Alkaliphilus peptidifermentans DSM 18978 TaxID=1120976 RepID=A0A1G5C032_9FIRM|nr:alanyl-tRNA synthetase [Alkaliphilus peptidifermentans DSM 18978]
MKLYFSDIIIDSKLVKYGVKQLTRKLFWEDPYLASFSTTIVSINDDVENAGSYLVELAETAFYPEGGGQPWDEGQIGDANVTYVFEKNDKIYHRVDILPTKKEQVECKINWERRFDFMQQHLGQHILSSRFHKLFNARTIGFHLGKDTVTIDLLKDSFTVEEFQRVEEEANHIIHLNLPVFSLYPSDEELDSLPLRKAPKVEDNIRLVEVKNTDYSPCGGTHPSRTGEVGIIKIRKWEKMRGNVRVEFVCGLRAVMDSWGKYQQFNSITNLLSVGDTEAFEAVEKIHADNKRMNKQLNQLKKSLLEYQIKDYYSSADKIKDYSLVVKVFDNVDMKYLQQVASLLNQYPKTIALLAARNDKAQVVFTRSKELKIDINQLFKEVISLIDGKGGGSEVTAQGGGSNISNLEGLMDAAVLKLKHEYIK